jgi:alpha-galactosidase
VAGSIIWWGHSRLSVGLRIDGGPVRLVGLSDSPVTAPERPVPDSSAPLVEVLAAGYGRTHSSAGYVDSTLGSRLRYRRHRTDTVEGWQQLTVELDDPHSGLAVEVVLRSVDGMPVLRTWAVVHNGGPVPLVLQAVTSFAAGAFATDAGDVALVSARGGWLAEGRWETRPLRPDLLPDLNAALHGHEPRGRVAATSQGTWSTAEHLPVAALTEAASGRTWLWQIEHNGAWHWEVGDRRDGPYVLLLGPTDAESQWQYRLDPRARFSTVPVAVAISASGGTPAAFAAMTRYRRALRRPHPDATVLPVVFNDYMNTLMGDPTTQKLLPLVAAAAAVGAETFVIDAGWYDDGGDWWDSVGEWQPSRTRFPNGLTEVLDEIRESGMNPGLWLEPEVIGVHSPMVGTLPADAFFHRGGVRHVEAQRYHLDLRHPAATAHLDVVVDRLVEQFGVGHLKLDYNINPGPGTDLAAASVGAGLLDHNRAHLAWLDGVLDRHPTLTLENCASGAMRSDYAMLARLQLQSTSDQQDYLRYPPVAAAAPASVAPEQAGNWAYPQPDMSPEQIAFTMCTGMSGRLYLSGRLDGMSDDQLTMVVEAVAAYRGMRHDIARSVPFWPLGLPGWADGWVALGLDAGDTANLVLWRRPGAPERVELPVPRWAGRRLGIEPTYPTTLPSWEMAWRQADGVLAVHATVAPPTARILRLTPSTEPTASGDQRAQSASKITGAVSADERPTSARRCR